ncbi:NAD(P)H-dependent glycerol-3-phosphate dehydrogenase [Tepidamorphus sp. 3E244]|uniref:NAD(P)H-dependent glycerol-3-phosphate dehydrogenase n=1 Tax=Tepidamorphus sp. 3E244 TaxID=3385498 RepID=UPI0038FD3887
MNDAGPSSSHPRCDQIAVIGAGAWGTALAAAAARAGRNVRLYARRRQTADEINTTRRNDAYLGPLALPDEITAVTAMDDAVRGADAVLLVVPSSAIRETARDLENCVPRNVPVVICAKGVEPGSGLLLCDVVAEEMPDQTIAVLSGPTFADEVAADMPTSVCIASSPVPGEPVGEGTAAQLALALSAGSFRAYVSDDPVGVEIGGAMKNVIAIACGISRGAGFRSNMTAALITRGLAEMTMLATALGGRAETVAGLSGLGDLTLTCSSEQSRNLRFGLQLGAGTSRQEAFGGAPVIVEGVRNAVSVTDLARKHGLSLPICEAVRAIVHDHADIGTTLGDLWAQPLEFESNAHDTTFRHPDANMARERIEELIG